MSPREVKPANPHDTSEYLNFEQRVSKYYEVEPRTRIVVDVAARTHPGKVRPNNEDHYLAVKRYRGRELLVTSLPAELLEPIDDHAYTFAVADGMGGRNFGELASLIALLTGWDLGTGEVKWTIKVNDREKDDLRKKARVFIELINQTILEETRANPKLSGMGTTLTLCYTTGPELFVIHVGDSRAYLYRKGALRQLTRDHNMAQVLIDSGTVAADSPDAKKMRHVLTNVLGGPNSAIEVDVAHEQLEDGDLLLLCTDGLTDMLDDEMIAKVLAEAKPPTDTCQDLLNLALEHGGKDNVTVLLARYEFQKGNIATPAIID